MVFSPANLIALVDHITESKQKVKEGQRNVPLSTLCKNFKNDHNIKDKKCRDSKTKTGIQDCHLRAHQ
ncbi:MAG: hypothetical protein ACR5KV_07655 [Wolbachia sp.]